MTDTASYNAVIALGKPKFYPEYTVAELINNYKSKLKSLLPDWEDDNKSDPAVAVMEACAYREMLLRQEVNEGVRNLIPLYAKGIWLDAACLSFYGITRLPGAAATCSVKIISSSSGSLPQGYLITDQNGLYRAALMAETDFDGAEEKTCLFEIVNVSGALGNGLNDVFKYAVNPLSFIDEIEQVNVTSGGSDPEDDESFRIRGVLSLSRFSVAGPRAAYKFWALSADPRIKDVSIQTPEPNRIVISVLSKEESEGVPGRPDDAMIQRVIDMFDDDDLVPVTDDVTVERAVISDYTVTAEITLYPDAPAETLTAAEQNLDAVCAQLFAFDHDIKKTRLITALCVPGVQNVEIDFADIQIGKNAAAYCSGRNITMKAERDV